MSVRCAKLVTSPPPLRRCRMLRLAPMPKTSSWPSSTKPPPALRVAVADAEVEVPRLALAQRHLHVGERVRRRTQRIDRRRVEGDEVAEAALPGDQLVRDQHVARPEGQGAAHEILAGEQEPSHEDTPDAGLLALVDVVADVHRRVAADRLDADDGPVVAAAGVESLDGALPVLRLSRFPRGAGLERQRGLDLARRERARAFDGDGAGGEPRALA